jgi:hypothetical protein
VGRAGVSVIRLKMMITCQQGTGYVSAMDRLRHEGPVSDSDNHRQNLLKVFSENCRQRRNTEIAQNI